MVHKAKRRENHEEPDSKRFRKLNSFLRLGWQYVQTSFRSFLLKRNWIMNIASESREGKSQIFALQVWFWFTTYEFLMRLFSFGFALTKWKHESSLRFLPSLKSHSWKSHDRFIRRDWWKQFFWSNHRIHFIQKISEYPFSTLHPISIRCGLDSDSWYQLPSLIATVLLEVLLRSNRRNVLEKS